jgi:antirestriction protein ArdC
MSKFDIYEMVTNQIIDRLEKGIVPWQMPWKTESGIPRNLISKKAYRGINFWYLLSFNLERPYFLTFNQIRKIGARLKKGSESFRVIFWKLLEIEKDDSVDTIPYLRYYRIFHIDSIEGIPDKLIPKDKDYDRDFNPISSCEQIVRNWKDKPIIELNHQQAAYMPWSDKVIMPCSRTFYKDEYFYSVLYHELTHSTGHSSRTGRHKIFPNHQFGCKDYSQEELCAEMGAAYLCGITGIDNKTIDNSAAYLNSWLSKLKSDKKFIIQAATHAQRATDYILENQQNPFYPVPIPEEEPELVSFSY